MEIGIIVIAVILIIVAYYIGKNNKNSVSTQEKIDNAKLYEEQRQLQNQNKDMRQRIQEIEQEYNSKKKFITDIESTSALAQANADLAYSEKIRLLNRLYEEKEKEKETEYDILLSEYKNQVEEAEYKLNSLKKTYAAAIEAKRRDEEVLAERDAFRLDVSEQDKKDISILSTVRAQISKPRILDMLIWQTYFQPIAKKKFPLILGSEKITGIYKITNIKNDKCYIGQAVDMRDRWNQHCKCGLGIDVPQGNKLYQAMMQDGLENFTFEVLEKCTTDELNNNEKFYIEMFNSKDYGYNSIGGNNG